MNQLADFGPLKEFIPGGLLESLGLGRAEECIQPLIDLGYLKESEYDPQVATAALTGDGIRGKAVDVFGRKMADALASFRSEAIESGLLHGSLVGMDLKEGEDANCVPGTIELDLLHRLVALDGETELDEVPAIGLQNLDSRILHYQLQILGLYEGDPNAPLSEAGMKGIWQLQNWFDLDQEAKVLPLLGDIAKLSRQVLTSLGVQEKSHVIAYFKEPYKIMRGLGTKPKAFIKELERVVDAAQIKGFFKNFNPKRATLKRRLLNPTKVGQLTRAPFNRFLLRLVQVRQWMRGFYHGKLDFWFGPQSIKSLKGYSDALDFDVGELLVRAGRDDSGGEYWALNIAALLGRIKGQEDASGEASVNGLVDQFEKSLESMDSEHRAEVVSQLKKGTAAHHRAHQKGLVMGRRIYLGVRSMVQSIESGFGKLLKWIKDGVARLVNLGKNLFRLISRQLREGLRSFGSGISFLFSNRQIVSQTRSGKAIVSDFDPDFDFILAVPTQVNAQELEVHLNLLETKIGNLNFCLRLTGTVLNWVIRVAQGPVGWLKLALHIAKSLRRMLVKRLRGQGKSLSGLSIHALA